MEGGGRRQGLTASSFPGVASCWSKFALLGLMQSMKSAIIAGSLKRNVEAAAGREGFGGGRRPLERRGLRDHSAVAMPRGLAFPKVS